MRTTVTTFALEQAEEALDAIRSGAIQGAAVLQVHAAVRSLSGRCHRTSNCSSGTAARRIRARSPTCGPRSPTRASTRTAIDVREVPDDDAAPSASAFTGSPTIRIDGRDVVDPGGEPVMLACRIYHRRDGRISPVPDPDDLRDALRRATTDRRSLAMSLRIGAHAPPFDLPATDGTSAGVALETQPAGDGHRLHLQPLPVRARLARPDRRRRRATTPSTASRC